jgi:PadR family transcriptional regulator AphA
MSKNSKTRFAVLGMLSMGPASGYDIKKLMSQSTDHFWREGDGSIYPILKELLDEGMVNCETINGESGKPKKQYTITEDGLRELQDWLKEDSFIATHRIEVMLKVFFGWNVNKQVTIDHIKKLHLRSVEMRKSLEKLKNDFIPTAGPGLYRFLTIQSGMLHAEASIKWCEEALERLNHEK